VKRWTTDGSAESDTRYPAWIRRRRIHRFPNWLLNLIAKASRKN
jgi:hypothetical protein